MRRIVLFGAYGYGNLGDDLLADYYRALLCEAFPGEERVILSARPLEEAARPGEVFCCRRQLSGLLRNTKPGDIWVGGGGSLLQNQTSRRSLFFYLALIWAARQRGAKIALLGQGYGPVMGRFCQDASRRVLSRVDLIEARDGKTLDFFEGLSIQGGELGRVADPVWGLEKPTIKQGRSDWLMILKREDANDIRRLLATGPEVKIRVLALAPSDGYALKNACGEKFEGVADLSLLWAVLQDAEMVFSSRLHGLILAALGGSAVFGLGMDPKITSLCSELRIPCMELRSLNLQSLNAQVSIADLAERVRGLHDTALLNRRETLARLSILANLN